MDEMILFVRSFVRFISSFAYEKRAKSWIPISIFSPLFFHNSAIDINLICVSSTQQQTRTFSKQNKIGVNFSEFENCRKLNYRVLDEPSIDFLSILLIFLMLSFSLIFVVWTHIISNTTLILPTFEWMFSATQKKKHFVCFSFDFISHCLSISSIEIALFFAITWKIWNSAQSVVECVKFNEPLNEWDWNGQIYCEKARRRKRETQ